MTTGKYNGSVVTALTRRLEVAHIYADYKNIVRIMKIFNLVATTPYHIEQIVDIIVNCPSDVYKRIFMKHLFKCDQVCLRYI